MRNADAPSPGQGARPAGIAGGWSKSAGGATLEGTRGGLPQLVSDHPGRVSWAVTCPALDPIEIAGAPDAHMSTGSTARWAARRWAIR
ncbi:MAG: hypothetical protein WAL04_00130 [Acidimicrobiales bacterium]